ncbi:hypothetical protein SDC9_70392 [bioreactor metagenome]|uniref:Uncharacterized protein n=1 Tax=bioreactor metagenome TaxID=1076179 RepID=A0A644Y5U4_9ZZZZ
MVWPTELAGKVSVTPSPQVMVIIVEADTFWLMLTTQTLSGAQPTLLPTGGPMSEATGLLSTVAVTV